MWKLSLISLGCAKNLVDSEVMLAGLQDAGFALTAEPGQAEVIVVNTCGFINDAKEESIAAILSAARFKEQGCRVLVAAGCLAQRYGGQLLAEIPELDAVVGVNDLHGIEEAVRRAFGGEKAVLTEGEYQAPEGAARLLATPSHTAYLKIAEGCDNRCTYCAIPSIRGPYRSRERRVVLAEAEKLVASGVKELNLVAQDITLYGQDKTGRLEIGELLKELSLLPGLVWIRLLYAYPERLDDRLIEAVAENRKVCRYLDLPLQHGSDSILQRMGRKLTGDRMLQLLERLRREIPGVTLRSSFIVGFPGEKEQDFRRLLEFLAAARLERAGFFAYSREEGTPAASFSGQLSEKCKQERLARAVELQSRVISEHNRSLVGSNLTVMLDGRSGQEATVTLARSEGQAPEVDGYVRLRGSCGPFGSFITARITGFEGIDLLAETVAV
ncbi:MAG: Ribosomal protein S12 methylthiotransferase RimO [Syntrophomonadaceae bacterium]|nr:Ribosomal protein S12 methylthiotransferase RimO [Bacillota bacterium]